MWIDSIKVEGGILGDFQQEFSANLNVLIGGRGTGKSSVIELIRFCLGAPQLTDENDENSVAHAIGVLGDGKVTVTLTDGTRTVEIQRTAIDDASDEEAESIQPYIFSQREIERIGLQTRSRLKLIDGFIGINLSDRTEKKSLEAKIKSATEEIRATLLEVDEITDKTAELAKLESELEKAKSKTADQTKTQTEILEFRGQLESLTPKVAAAGVRADYIERTVERYSNWVESLEQSFARRPQIENWPAQAETPDALSQIRKRTMEAGEKAALLLNEYKEILASVTAIRTKAQKERTDLENSARDIRQKMDERVKGASSIDKQIGDLSQRVSVLKSLFDLKKQRLKSVVELKAARAALLKRWTIIRQMVTDRRTKVARDLNESLGPTIRVTIKPYAQARDYESALTTSLRGSGLRYQELAGRIAEHFSPQEIASIAEDMNALELAKVLEITDERALRVCQSLRKDGGSALFVMDVDDDVEIELLDGADYKGIDFLSLGQRCTAVLPIILKHNEKVIILDQPEDHLDNAFIVGTLVQALRNRSENSQTIVATHNPNIPVLGEANQVVHLDSDGSRCFAQAAGEVDAPEIVSAITSIMEGGMEAFTRRAKFYEKNSRNVT